MKLKLDIKSVIDELGTQTSFSELSGLNKNTVNRLYNGVGTISLKVLAKVMQATGKQPNDLFVVTEKPNDNGSNN